MTEILKCISPIDGAVYAERPAASDAHIQATLERARACQAAWRNEPVAERAALCTAMVDAFIRDSDAVAEELARQMGRPARYGAGEVMGFAERARHMIAIAGEALADRPAPDKPGFTRFIRPRA
ncbi:MAG: aldehyde dehydrogenase family protein, partial [Rhodospirillales bacterium]